MVHINGSVRALLIQAALLESLGSCAHAFEPLTTDDAGTIGS